MWCECGGEKGGAGHTRRGEAGRVGAGKGRSGALGQHCSGERWWVWCGEDDGGWVWDAGGGATARRAGGPPARAKGVRACGGGDGLAARRAVMRTSAAAAQQQSSDTASNEDMAQFRSSADRKALNGVNGAGGAPGSSVVDGARRSTNRRREINGAVRAVDEQEKRVVLGENQRGRRGDAAKEAEAQELKYYSDHEERQVCEGAMIHRLGSYEAQYKQAKLRERILPRLYEECQRITAVYAKTFALGTSFLAPAKRTAVWAIYVWCRRTDDLVDGPRVEQRCSSLRDVLADWERRLEGLFRGEAQDGLELAFVDTVRRYPAMEIQPYRDMIAGMLMDVEQDRFETFDDLYVYCYRVAGTVGLMTLPVMGSADGSAEMLEAAKPAALSLGVALQLTNILRDVGEDRLRGRIYIPQEDLRRFDYSEKDLMDGVIDSRYIRLMQFQIARARSYFDRAHAGIGLLSSDARLPVQASLEIYRKILDVIEENGYDNFTKRAYVPKSEKLMMLPGCYFRSRDPSTLAGQLAQAIGSML
ncbi:All-trans-phytoene synthase [Porphyridium purpureum]|uniref:15-cis-phytoene synthase n=1 Tax=Porphyridium purpureum TaxID=35688 RepID=A0A5J4YJ52_PORPP|nr:All-trans-phytoene synthase [Porphyridium purpureum]|eukprot:POR4718..scf261_15